MPTTKILAIGQLSDELTPERRKVLMPQEVPDTVRLYLAGKIDQWWGFANPPQILSAELHRARCVALAREVVSKDHITRSKTARGAIADLDFHLPRENKNVLAPGHVCQSLQ